MENFYEMLKAGIEKAIIGETGLVEVNRIHTVKANYSYEGLSIKPIGSNIGMCYDMTKDYEAYMDGTPISELIGNAIKTISEGLSSMPQIDASELSDYNKIQDKLSVELISATENEEFLKGVPHINMLDLAVIFRISIEGNASVVVNNEMLNEYKVSKDELFKDALKASMKNRPARLNSLTDVIRDMTGGEFDMGDNPGGNEPMYVATVKDNTKGACVMIYEDFLKNTADFLNCSFFIIPSSIHEILVIPDSSDMRLEDLSEMLHSVNDNEVHPSDRLSYTVYHYDRAAEKLETGEDYLLRTA